MPLQFEIDIAANLVRATIIGNANLTAPEFREFLSAVIAHPDYQPGFDFFYDRSAVTAMPDETFVRAALDEIGRHADQLKVCKWAVLIGAQPALDIVRMTAMLSERPGIEARPFISRESAFAWLDRDV